MLENFQTKYALLDERDISLVHEYAFEARTEIDKNGCGATIFAYAYKYDKGRSSGIYVQDLLWEKHCGELEPGFRVVHKNCISVDNRLENLMLVPSALAPRWCQHNTVATASSSSSIGKKHALKKYDQFAPNTSCFYPSSCAISRNFCYKNKWINE